MNREKEIREMYKDEIKDHKVAFDHEVSPEFKEYFRRLREKSHLI